MATALKDFADRSIRKHHAGAHTVTLIINSREMASAAFSLVRGRRLRDES